MTRCCREMDSNPRSLASERPTLRKIMSPEERAGQSPELCPSYGDRRFESVSLQQGVHCKPDFLEHKVIWPTNSHNAALI